MIIQQLLRNSHGRGSSIDEIYAQSKGLLRSQSQSFRNLTDSGTFLISPPLPSPFAFPLSLPHHSPFLQQAKLLPELLPSFARGGTHALHPSFQSLPQNPMVIPPFSLDKDTTTLQQPSLDPSSIPLPLIFPR